MKNLYLLIICLMVVGCGSDETLTEAMLSQDVAQSGTQSITSRMVSAQDATGIGTAFCSVGESLTGGGCLCDFSAGDMFASGPNNEMTGWVCGCNAVGLVTIYAICSKLE